MNQQRIGWRRSSDRLIVALMFLIALLGFGTPTWSQAIKPGVAIVGKREHKERYVWRSRLTSSVQDMLNAFGDRLERFGQERNTLNGVLKFSSEEVGLPVTIVRESPGLLAIALGQRGDGSIVKFNGTKIAAAGTISSEHAAGLVELLADDSVEQFFFGHMRGYGTTYLGHHFWLEGISAASETDSPFSVFIMLVPQSRNGKVAYINKFYYFNGRTRLLECIRYSSGGNQIDVKFGGWGWVGIQAVPGSIVRYVNGQPVYELTLTSSETSAAIDDGLFVIP